MALREARRRLEAPAIFLLLVAASNLFGGVAGRGILMDALGPFGLESLGSDVLSEGLEAALGQLVWAHMMIASSFTLAGSVAMMRMRNLPLARTGALCAMLVPSCCMIGVLVGFASLCVLYAPPAVRGFRIHAAAP